MQFDICDVKFAYIEFIHQTFDHLRQSNDKLIVRFDEDLRDNNGNNYPVNVMAIFTLKDNKIEQWDEVANTQYFCTRESKKVVFSK